MAVRIRAADWARTPLGLRETWPQSLRTSVGLCLASNLPINIIWGPHHCQIYNDAYAALCGDAHPAVLGQAFDKTWASAWPAIAGPFARALGGEASALADQHMFLSRSGRLAETAFTLSFSPIRDESGAVGGVFHTVIATSFANSKTHEEALTQREQELDFALRAGGLGSWQYDIATRRFTASHQSRVVFGLEPGDAFETAEDVAARVHPEDRLRRQAAVDQAITTGGELDIEYRVIRSDGQIGWVLARGRAAQEGGRSVRLAGISLDITARKQAEQRQRLLLDELNHRVKNTLATVQSIALQTLRNVEDPSDFSAAFLQRVLALSQAHDLLTEGSWEGASLMEVISRTMRLQVIDDLDGRIAMLGPAMRLGPNTAVMLNMVFHELATNATKYGALSTASGQIDIKWDADPATQAFTLDWRESGGPPVTPPARRGFGSRLIEQGISREMGAAARLTFLRDGLWCRIRMPLSAKLSLAA